MKSSPRQTLAFFAVLTLVVSALPSAQAQRFGFGGKSSSSKSKSSSGNRMKSFGNSFGSKSPSQHQNSSRNRLSTLGTSGLSKFHSTHSPTKSFQHQGIRTQDLLQRRQSPTNQSLGNHHWQQSRGTTGQSKLNHSLNNYRPMVGRPSSSQRLDQLKQHFQSGSHGNTHRNPQHRIHDLIRHNQTRNKICVSNHGWCHSKPKHCHWWYNWCKPIRYCEPTHHVNCQWNYVQCDYVVAGRVVIEDARWYLGLKGLFLPGKGVGIESITPGSPAAFVGLQPGMVITRCNGVELFDEQALEQVIAQSQGVLRLELVLNDTGAPATCTVVMQRVPNGQNF